MKEIFESSERIYIRKKLEKVQKIFEINEKFRQNIEKILRNS